MATQQIRKAKLQQKYRSLTYSEQIVPELRLSGIWLDKHGFKVGLLVDVKVSKGKLIITPKGNVKVG